MKNKKYVGTMVVGTILVILFSILTVLMLLAIPAFTWIAGIYAVNFAAAVLITIYVVVQRLREIDSGDEDALDQS